MRCPKRCMPRLGENVKHDAQRHKNLAAFLSDSERQVLTDACEFATVHPVALQNPILQCGIPGRCKKTGLAKGR